MVSLSQFQTGLANYVDTEIVSKINGLQKWFIGAAAGIALGKSVEIFNALKENEVVKLLGIIDEDDRIDLDALHAELKRQAHKSGAITINVPMLGALTLNESDVDKLAAAIRAAQ